MDKAYYIQSADFTTISNFQQYILIAKVLSRTFSKFY